MSASPPEAVLSAIATGQRFVLSSHANPDGDAIGSEIGLARILAKLGKESLIWNRDGVPPLYRPMPGTDRIHAGASPPDGFPAGFDGAIILECPSLDRTGLESFLPSLPLINIDHHLGNVGYGVAQWVDELAPAVGEMVFRLARAMGVEVDAETATCLYLTLVTDTGGFRFANASATAFRAAADLVAAGARPEQVSQWLYESYPPGMIRLLGAMLGTLELHLEGRISSVLLTQQMFQAAGAAPGDSESLIDFPRSIAGVCATALLREKAPGRVKVSLRSRGAVDVEKVARQHGGGGHKNAAGFELPGSPGELRAQVVAEVARAVEEALS